MAGRMVWYTSWGCELELHDMCADSGCVCSCPHTTAEWDQAGRRTLSMPRDPWERRALELGYRQGSF